MKRKGLLGKFFDNPKELFKKYPLSISLSILFSFIIAIFLDTKFLENTIVLMLVLSAGVLFSEILFYNNKLNKWIGCIIALIIAVVSNKYIIENNSLISKITAIYILAIVIIGLIKLFKNSKDNLGKYTTKVCSNLFKTHLIFSVLSMGLLMIGLIIISLFFKDADDLFLLRLEILVGGIYYIPSLIYSFTSTDNNALYFIVFILNNIASILLMITFLIIYVYMFKIIITWNIPSNHIFRIISLLFILGLPLWTMINSFDQDNIVVKICQKLPIAFIPLIALQIYSLLLRISSNGFTVTRYVGLMLLIVEICYLVLYIVKEEKIYTLGYLIIVMAFIGIIVPKINAIDVAISSQYKTLTKLLDKKTLSPKEHSRLYSAYIYLQDFKEGRKYLVDLTEEQIEFITEAKEVEYNCYYSSEPLTLYNVDISGYSKLSEFEINKNADNLTFNELHEVDVKGNVVDFYSYVNKFIKTEDDYSYVKESKIISTENYKIYVNEIDVCIEENDLKSYTISGYILEK